MFKWPIIVLFALFNLCFFILMMSLEETLLPITKGELPLILALKFLKSTEISASFRCNLLSFKCLLDSYYCE